MLLSFLFLFFFFFTLFILLDVYFLFFTRLKDVSVCVAFFSFLLLKMYFSNTKIINNLQTPLHLAAFYGHEKIVQLLLDHGAEVNCKDVTTLPFSFLLYFVYFVYFYFFFTYL
jgi:hypothetical protein